MRVFIFLFLVLSVRAAQLTVAWTVPVSPATFTVKRADVATPTTWTYFTAIPGTSRSFTDTSLVAGHAYLYQVMGVNTVVNPDGTVGNVYGTPSATFTTPVIPTTAVITSPVATASLHPGDQMTYTNGTFKPKPNGPVTALAPNTSATTQSLPQ